MEVGSNVLPRVMQSLWNSVAEGQEHPQPAGLLCLGKSSCLAEQLTSALISNVCEALIMALLRFVSASIMLCRQSFSKVCKNMRDGKQKGSLSIFVT